MHFDIVILDTTANKFYDRITLEKEALGGSEASVVRVAEGLGSLGLKVAVVEARLEKYFEPIIGQYAFFIHANDTEGMTCRHYIQLRKNQNPAIFKGAKKYLWLHDMLEDEVDPNPLYEHNIQIIGVSRWHRKNIQEFTKDYEKVTHIYNPVPDELYDSPRSEYNKNVLVWMSSPHKGLDKGIALFKKIHEKNPNIQLIVFNPGYKHLNVEKLSVIPGISVYGSMNCHSVWNVVKKSLCVFYPTDYEETFGCVAAEANALGVPLVTYRNAGLGESVTSDNQFVTSDDEAIEKVLKWSTEGRPIVTGQNEFKTSNIIMDWVRLLAK